MARAYLALALGQSRAGLGLSRLYRSFVELFALRPRAQPGLVSRPLTSRAENDDGYDSSLSGLFAPQSSAVGARRSPRSFWRLLLAVALLGLALWPRQEIGRAHV